MPEFPSSSNCKKKACMSRTGLSEKIKLRIWLRAGGRCQYPGCNQPLWKDDLTLIDMNRSYLAHIISDRPDGPRGHPKLSEQLKADPENIMLLCDTHHRLIDREDVQGHPPMRLCKMKKDHEDRIERQTSVHTHMRTHIVMLSTQIGSRRSKISYDQACQAVINNRYPAAEGGIKIDLSEIEVTEDDPEFFELSTKYMERVIRSRLQDGAGASGIPLNHLSIFALAPIPILIRFGEILGDIIDVDVYQRHRTHRNWQWMGLADEHFEYQVLRPETASRSKNVVVNLSLSGTIHEEEVASILPGSFPSYVITHSRPRLEFLQSKEQLELFTVEWRALLAEIRQFHGENVEVHLFPAIPCSVAVEIGRSLLPKVGPKLHIYEKKRNTGFKRTITVP